MSIEKENTNEKVITDNKHVKDEDLKPGTDNPRNPKKDEPNKPT